MKRKYETRCWLCGSTDLEPDARGIRCRSCNATFNLIPKPSQDPIAMHKDLGAGGYSSSPSDSLVEAAAKARGD